MKILKISDSNLSYPTGINIGEAVKYINKVYPKVNRLLKGRNLNIWCRGSSGAILGALLASKIPNSRVVHVRKPGEGSHDNYPAFLDIKDDSGESISLHVILDDFSETGNTVNSIYKEMKFNKLKCSILILSRHFREIWNMDFVPEYFICGIMRDKKFLSSLKPRI